MHSGYFHPDSSSPSTSLPGPTFTASSVPLSARVHLGISLLQRERGVRDPRATRGGPAFSALKEKDSGTPGMAFRIHVPGASSRSYVTRWDTVAADFRAWGYRVEAEGAGSSVGDARARGELLDMWSREWIRRYCAARGGRATWPGEFFVGEENFAEGVRGVDGRRGRGGWSWRGGLEALGLVAREGGGFRGELERREGVEEELPKYERGEKPPAYQEG